MVKQVGEGTLHGEVSKVKVSFLEYKYQLLKPGLHFSKFNCVIAESFMQAKSSKEAT
jgi:hypothetical protein